MQTKPEHSFSSRISIALGGMHWKDAVPTPRALEDRKV